MRRRVSHMGVLSASLLAVTLASVDYGYKCGRLLQLVLAIRQDATMPGISADFALILSLACQVSPLLANVSSVVDELVALGGEVNVAAWRAARPLHTSTQAHGRFITLPACGESKRVGLGGEQSKVLCGWSSKVFTAPCHIVSIGSNGGAKFETQMHALVPHYSLETWDGSLVGRRAGLRAALPNFTTFVPVNFGRTSWQTQTYTRLAVLKIDCEGCEMTALLPWLEHVCTDRILVEVHAFNLTSTAILLNQLVSSGYYLGFGEDNPTCGARGRRAICVELSLVRGVPCATSGSASQSLATIKVAQPSQSHNHRTTIKAFPWRKAFMAAALSPQQDYCSAKVQPEGVYTCAFGCGINAKDSLGAQMHYSFLTLKSALRSNCRYVHTRLVRGENHMHGWGNLHRAQNLFRMGSGCVSTEQIAFDLRSYQRSLNHSGLLTYRNTGPAYGVSDNTASVNVTPVFVDFARRWVSQKKRCVLAGVEPQKNGIGVQSFRSIEALAGILRRLGNVTTPWFASRANDARVLRVAVHVRRGDLRNYASWAILGRWVPDPYYEKWLPRIAAAMWRGGQGVRSEWHIMSEGETRLWAPLQRAWNVRLFKAGASSVHWHIEARQSDFLTSIVHMIAADVLVLAKSAYSTLAATYSLGVLVSVPFARNPSDVPEAQYSELLDDKLCLRSIHMLPAPPSCSCLANATRFRLSSWYIKLCKRKPESAAVVPTIGDSWRATPSWLDAHRCWLSCRSDITLDNDKPAGVASQLELQCAGLGRTPPYVAFEAQSFAAEIDEHVDWRRSLGFDSVTRLTWTSVWAHVALQARPFTARSGSR